MSFQTSFLRVKDSKIYENSLIGPNSRHNKVSIEIGTKNSRTGRKLTSCTTMRAFTRSSEYLCKEVFRDRLTKGLVSRLI